MKQFSDARVEKVKSPSGSESHRGIKLKRGCLLFLHTLKLSRKIEELMMEVKLISQRPEFSKNELEGGQSRTRMRSG